MNAAQTVSNVDRPPPLPAAAPARSPNQALWEMGDFTRIASSMRASGEALVRRLDLGPGMKVLDLGCGDGTTALPAAQAGAQVLGVDIARNLVAAGQRRAREAGLESRCRFVEGDACDLSGVENASFDRVVSIFGAMFAPKPFDVAREMVRVTKPGGRIHMGNWIPGDPTLVAQLLKISTAYAPPPPAGFVSPMTWGLADHVRERFGQAGIPAEAVRCEPVTWVFDLAESPAAFVDLFRRYYGPTMKAFEAADGQGRAETLREELVALFEAQNESQYPGTLVIPATFLLVTVDVH
ncbi:MAG: class I SAM-dependent methyltransferase [Burkholderiales bacterium]|nr:class I SAM-dependent methyltransferase [Burkholderiales bacterium]